MPLPAPLHPFLSSSLLPPGFGSKMGQPLRCGRRRRGAFCGDSVAKPLPQFPRRERERERAEDTVTGRENPNRDTNLGGRSASSEN